MEVFFNGGFRLHWSIFSSAHSLYQTDDLTGQNHRQQGATQPAQVDVGGGQSQHHQVADEVGPLDVPVGEL